MRVAGVGANLGGDASRATETPGYPAPPDQPRPSMSPAQPLTEKLEFGLISRRRE
jgi:hypothetical protein